VKLSNRHAPENAPDLQGNRGFAQCAVFAMLQLLASEHPHG
jgi:hypothetical protein